MKKRKRIKRFIRSSSELEEFKAFLGPLAADYTDGELWRLRRDMDAMAEILLELFIARQKKPPERTIEF